MQAIPDEVLVSVFSWLTPIDLMAVRAVSSRFRRLCPTVPEVSKEGAVLCAAAPICAAALSPDGRWVTYSPQPKPGHTGTLAVRCVIRGKGVDLATPSGVTCLAWSRDCRRIACGLHDGRVVTWDGRTNRELRGHRGKVICVAWSRDGRRVASSGLDGVMRVWIEGGGEHWGDGDGGAFCGAFRHYSTASIVSTLAWDPTGWRIASGGGGGQVRVWDSEDGSKWAERRRLGGCADTVLAADWRGDGKMLAIGGNDGCVTLWDVSRLDPLQNTDRLPGQRTQPVQRVAWSPDGQHIATACSDGVIQVWDTRTLRVVRAVVVGQRGCIKGLGWGPDGTWLMSAADTTVRTWAVPVPEPL